MHMQEKRVSWATKGRSLSDPPVKRLLILSANLWSFGTDNLALNGSEVSLFPDFQGQVPEEARFWKKSDLELFLGSNGQLKPKEVSKGGPVGCGLCMEDV